MPSALTRRPSEAVIAALEPYVSDRRRETLRSVFAARLDSVRVLFDAPYDPHNGAAVIRSCDAFGVQTLHVVERQKEFLIAKSVARGAERWVEVLKHPGVSDAATCLEEQGYTLVGASADGALRPEDLPSIPKLCLVMGNERDGIAEELLQRCKQQVRVPMRGFVESLNVSVTSAILLAAATHGRPGDFDATGLDRLYARALYLSVQHADELLEHALGAAPAD